MTQDRNYLRMLSNRELINMGRERDSGDDLVLVLAERLSDLAHFKAHLEAAQAEIDDLTEDRDYWELKANASQEELEALQAHIDATRGYGPDE
jgi:hypothetical protein